MSAANESTGDDQEHTPLRQGWERAELLHGWQRCGAGELCEPLGKKVSLLEHGRVNKIVSKLNECHTVVKKALGDQFRLL